MHASMLLSPANFGSLGLGRILSDRIGSKSTTHRIGIRRGRLPRRPFLLVFAFSVLLPSVTLVRTPARSPREIAIAAHPRTYGGSS